MKVLRDSFNIEGWDSIYREKHEEARRQLDVFLYSKNGVSVGVRHE